MTGPAIITLAPTGMVPTRADSPHVPLTPREVARDVAECAQVGITTVHLHARDEQGRPEWRREAYAALVGAVREAAPDVVICVSTSGRSVSEIEQRADALALDDDLKPDLASLTLSSLNFARHASLNAPEVVQGLASLMAERDIQPELEIFDLGMAHYAGYLAGKGILRPPFVANVFVGNIATAQATPLEFGLLVDRLPPGTHWCGAGIGAAQPVAHALALFTGGGVRVGLEDSLWLDRARRRPARNVELVERAHALAALAERTAMTPDDYRRTVLGR